MVSMKSRFVPLYFSLFIFLIPVCFTAQQNEPKNFHYNGLINASATISPGFLLNRGGATTMSIHGFLEFFPEDKISLRGDGFYFVGEQKKPAALYQNSTLKFGGFYHTAKNRFDAYIGFQPGVNFVQPVGQDINGNDFYYTFKIAPVISGVAGMNYHFGKLFNMFLETTYIRGRYLGDGFTSIDISEIRISAGLGFQISTRKNACDCSGLK
jgi:hypothetical protein